MCPQGIPTNPPNVKNLNLKNPLYPKFPMSSIYPKESPPSSKISFVIYNNENLPFLKFSHVVSLPISIWQCLKSTQCHSLLESQSISKSNYRDHPKKNKKQSSYLYNRSQCCDDQESSQITNSKIHVFQEPLLNLQKS